MFIPRLILSEGDSQLYNTNLLLNRSLVRMVIYIIHTGSDQMVHQPNNRVSHQLPKPFCSLQYSLLQYCLLSWKTKKLFKHWPLTGIHWNTLKQNQQNQITKKFIHLNQVPKSSPSASGNTHLLTYNVSFGFTHPLFDSEFPPVFCFPPVCRSLFLLFSRSPP